MGGGKGSRVRKDNPHRRRSHRRAGVAPDFALEGRGTLTGPPHHLQGPHSRYRVGILCVERGADSPLPWRPRRRQCGSPSFLPQGPDQPSRAPQHRQEAKRLHAEAQQRGQSLDLDEALLSRTLQQDSLVLSTACTTVQGSPTETPSPNPTGKPRSNPGAARSALRIRNIKEERVSLRELLKGCCDPRVPRLDSKNGRHPTSVASCPLAWVRSEAPGQRSLLQGRANGPETSYIWPSW